MKADPAPVRRRFSPACLVPFAIIFGLYLANVYNHLLFHALAELFSIIFISSIFLFTWNTRRFQENHYFLFLGIAYLFIGSIDFVHILTYKDGGDMLSEITMNSSIQFWVAARYMEGTSLLLAFLFLHKKINEYLLVLLYLLLTVLLFQSILGGSFPVCFVDGQGLTGFKKGSECAVCFLYLLTLFFFYKKQHQFDKRTLRFLQVSVSLTVLAELTTVFSAEFSNTPLDSTAGIFGKLFSLYCLAKAIFESSLIRPYNILISKLRAHEEQLEDKIRERTAALQQSTEQLEKEIIERVKAEKELVWELSVNKALASLSDALISRSYSMQEIAGALFDAAQRLTGCHQGFVSIVDHENETASIYPGTAPLALGKEMPVFVLSAQKDGQFPGLWGQTLNTQQGFYVDFISSQIQEGGDLPASLEPQRNFLNAPALLDNKVVGQIALADKPGGFSRHDLLAIERLAALFALFVHRREMEDALSRSEFEYRSLFDEALDMIHIVDAQKKITRVNPVELKTLGYREDQLVGMSLLDIVHPDYQERTKQNLEHIFLTGESVKNYETALVAQDGVSVNIEVSAVPQLEQGQVVSVRAIMRNITDRKREEREKKNLEVQLRHSQKMEAVGTLAGGIAHDFNNILGPIFGYTELALDVLPEDNRITSWLQEVLQASHRARELVRQILTISRKADKDVQPLRIQLLIKEALKLLRFSIPSNIEIRQQLAPDCEPVLADPTRIHQIIMNLCTNAYYAMRENGGILEVSLQQVMLRQEDLYDKIRLQEGAYLQLTVRDNGIGIPKELLEKIFEPYFTTKSQGEGTGLGLAVVQSIVLDFGGDITVSSATGQGTVFDVYFPVIQTEEETALPQEKASLPRGDERILVVDDDRDIVLMNQRILEMLGYQVRAWTESLEAFADFQQDPDAVDLVITDMTMPKMTGDELTRRLLALRPELPVLICTGFSELIDEDKARKLGARALLMKPLTKKELAWAVRQVLDQEK
ncbi:MAG: MASE3 domain-containing protein [Candidatus Electrothrix aestuarii]|uniref:histidine kinase n=1 Tax=Candidatus Electrothrix aestuarii TaxID=3062594 RepID=A0AAU8LWK4_9BACT|nr:MASE3 domain-containing protein [Candidatus Electrothrix aestuarii]